MNIEPKFQDSISKRIWDDHFRRAERILISAPKINRDELILELKGHLYESFISQSGESEADRLLSAIENMGILDDFLKPIVADKLLLDASKTFNPVTVMFGLFFSFYAGLKRGLLAFVLGLGYLVLFSFACMTILKLFIPSHVGLFFPKEGGLFSFGIIIDPSNMNEVLGYWIIPIGLLITFALYVGLTNQLKKTIRKTK